VSRAAPARACFWVDAGGPVGAGHVRRAEVLADAFAKRGVVSCLVAEDAEAARQVASGAHPVESRRDLSLPDCCRRLEARIAVLDLPHTRPTPRGELSALGAAGVRRIVFDGAPDAAADAELVVNAVASPDDYPDRAAHTRLLLGPRYAVLGPTFAALGAAPRRAGGGRPGRLLLGFGASDVAGLTLRALDALAPVAAPLGIDVLLGALVGSRTRKAVGRAAAALPDCRVHHAADPLPLLAEADIAVLGFGQLFLEAASAGVACVLWHPTPAHAQVAARLAARAGRRIAWDLGAAEDADEGALRCAVEKLASDDGLRHALSRAAADTVDGRGGERVARVALADGRQPS